MENKKKYTEKELHNKINKMERQLRLVTDISEKLEENIQIFEILFNSVSEGFFLHRGEILIEVNDSLAKMLGYDKQNIIGTSIYNYVDSKYHEQMQKRIVKQIEGGYEVELIKKTGGQMLVEVIPAQIIFRGEPARAVRVRDVTIQKQKDKESLTLKRRLERQRKSLLAMAKMDNVFDGKLEGTIESIVEIASMSVETKRVGVWFLSDSKKELDCMRMYNSETCKCSTGQQIDVKKYSDLFSRVVSNRLITLDCKADDKVDEKFCMDYFAENKIVSMICTPIRSSGVVLGMVTFERGDKESKWEDDEQDFTASVADMVVLAIESWNRKWIEAELEESFEKLQELDRQKSSFVSMISHELRTPLTSIMGFMAFLKRGVGGELSEQQVDFVNSIGKNADRLLILINDLLDISKLEAGSFSIAKSECDFVLVLNRCLTELSSIAASKNIKIVKEFLCKERTANVDSYRISQVLTNLVNNAVKFSPDNGKIIVKTRCNLHKQSDIPSRAIGNIEDGLEVIRVSVTDEGNGMEEEKLSVIFDRFFQIENINTRKHQGTGLGLNIAKEIVIQHKGIIWAESEGLGKGSAFTFILPVK